MHTYDKRIELLSQRLEALAAEQLEHYVALDERLANLEAPAADKEGESEAPQTTEPKLEWREISPRTGYEWKLERGVLFIRHEVDEDDEEEIWQKISRQTGYQWKIVNGELFIGQVPKRMKPEKEGVYEERMSDQALASFSRLVKISRNRCLRYDLWVAQRWLNEERARHGWLALEEGPVG
jgi:hypothetical protein